MTRLLQCFAWLLARLPDRWLEGLCSVCGLLIIRCYRKRRDLIYSNLDHAFPDADPAQLDAWARTSATRMVEMGLLALCSGSLSKGQIERRFHLDPKARQTHLEAQEKGRPIVMLVPHLSDMEMMTWLPLALPETLDVQISCIFRPLGNKALNKLILDNRSRLGMRLFDRKSGLGASMKILRQNGMLAMLFDQNVRDSGIVTLFFNRTCTASDLPALMAKKFDATVIFAWIERTGFWRGTYRAQPLDERWMASPLHITVGAQQTLETLLREHPEMIPDWLWSHNRWRGQTRPNKRLRIDHKKDCLAETAAILGLPRIPQSFRLCLRLPDDLNTALALLDDIARIPQHRPDAWIILVAPEAVLDAARQRTLGDEWLSPEALPGLAARYLDTVITFQPPSREDSLIATLRAPQRFAPSTPGTRRRGFTHCAEMPPELSPLPAAQFLLEHFGLPR